MNQYLKSARINSKGLGVAEALVGAAITIIVMMGFATYMVNAQRQQRQLMMKMDQKDLQALLLSANSALAIPAKCQDNLNSIVGIKPIGAAWPAEKIAGGVWAIKEYKSNGAVIGDIINSTGFVKGSNSLKVKSLKIVGLNNLLSNVGSTANVRFIIDVQSPDASAMKIRPIELNTQMTTIVNGPNIQLSSCKAEGAVDSMAAPEESLVWNYGAPFAGQDITLDISTKNMKAIFIDARGGGGGGAGGNTGDVDHGDGISGSGGDSGDQFAGIVMLPPGTTALKLHIGSGGAGGAVGTAASVWLSSTLNSLAGKNGKDTKIIALPSNQQLVFAAGGLSPGSPENIIKTPPIPRLGRWWALPSKDGKTALEVVNCPFGSANNAICKVDGGNGGGVGGGTGGKAVGDHAGKPASNGTGSGGGGGSCYDITLCAPGGSGGSGYVNIVGFK